MRISIPRTPVPNKKNQSQKSKSRVKIIFVDKKGSVFNPLKYVDAMKYLIILKRFQRTIPKKGGYNPYSPK